ncbi:MAG: YitT family protein [Fibrobacteraceae bacterium]|nr:YitT family protein [Fibrobacteraceae bacterium]
MSHNIPTFTKRPLTQFLAVRVLMIIVAAFLMALDLNAFAKSAKLFPGGFTGLALLLQEVVQRSWNICIPFSLMLVILNGIPAFASFFFIGKRYTLLSCVMILLSGVFTDVLPTFHITDDMLLSAIFGGLLCATAICLCLHAGATSGGTDFIAIFIAERSGADAWNYILAFNAAVLVSAGLLFGWDKSLYSIIFQFTSTQTMTVLYKKYQKATLLIITDKPDDVYKKIHQVTNHDATLFHGTGCYQGKERKMLYSVISAAEEYSVVRAIRKADPNVFLNVIKTGQLSGRFYNRPKD